MTQSNRDLRIDFFRGFSLITIFLIHAPWLFANLTWSQWGFSSAFELFVLLSGYISGLVYGKVLEKKGFSTCLKKIYSRIGDLWTGHMILGIANVAIIYIVSKFSLSISHELVNFFRINRILEYPIETTFRYMTLLYQPLYMDILPLYMVLLLPLPWILPILHRNPWKLLAGSVAVWVFVQLFPSEPIFRFMTFEPLGWQLLFVTGMVLQQEVKKHHTLKIPTWGLAVAWGIVIISFVSHLGFHIKVRNWMDTTNFSWLIQLTHYSYAHKREVSFIRIAHFAALLVLVKYHILNRKINWELSIFRPFIQCGQHSLQIYVFSSILAVLIAVKKFTFEKQHFVDFLLLIFSIIIIFEYAKFLCLKKRTKHFIDNK